MQIASNLINKVKNSGKKERLIIVMFSAVILLGIYISFLLYTSHRSLWIDEAMLAISFTKRSIWNLVSSKFEWNQSAPIIYLYLVKIITLLFGNTEFTLRVLSFFAYIGTLVVAYKLLARAFRVTYPIMGVAFISTIRVILYYSNEFKPYMSDCLCVLSVVFIYYLYNQKKIRYSSLILVYAGIVWLSHPTIFFVGAVLIYDAMESLLQKRAIKETLTKTLGGVIVLCSFIINYLIWLKPVAEFDEMIDFWVNFRFLLIPKNIDELYHVIWLVKKLMQSMDMGMIPVLILAVVGVLITIKERNRYGIVLAFGVLLTLVASFLGKYPFHYRLMLFVFPIMAIFDFISLDRMMKSFKGSKKMAIAVALLLAVFAANYGSLDYLQRENRYRSGEEANGIIEYLDEHIETGDLVYVYHNTIPIFSYRNGYDNFHIGEKVAIKENNVIHGIKAFEGEIGNVEIEKILGYEKCYFIFSHYKGNAIEPLFEALQENGHLELIKNEYDTLLYYYSSDKVSN